MGLMEDSYDYSTLTRKYGQFMAPVCKLTIDGKQLQGCGIESISISLSMEAASAVSFQVSGAYDLKSSAFDSGIKSKLRLGAIVEVELGYGSDTRKVFKGYICSVGVNFGDSPTLSITAMDARRLMMEGISREVTHVVTSYSAAFETVMKPYSPLCDKLQTDATTADEITQITQRLSDYDFINTQLCKKADREFFILYDTAYFRQKGKPSSPIMTLSWNNGLISFSRKSFYQNLDIVVIGFDPQNKETVKAEVSEKSSESQKAIGKDRVVITDPDAIEEEKAKKRAEKEARERKKKAQEGQASCVGLPEIVPGRYIKLTGLDSDLDRAYYIRDVQHDFGSDGFTTSFEIGGWN